MLQAAAVARARLPLGHYSEEPAVQATLEVIAIENWGYLSRPIMKRTHHSTSYICGTLLNDSDKSEILYQV